MFDRSPDPKLKTMDELNGAWMKSEAKVNESPERTLLKEIYRGSYAMDPKLVDKIKKLLGET